MIEEVVTTAERELRELLDWAFPAAQAEATTYLPTDEYHVFKRALYAEINRRIARIEGGYDGWRSRCLVAEKKNADYLAELRAVREELRDLKYGGTP